MKDYTVTEDPYCFPDLGPYISTSACLAWGAKRSRERMNLIKQIKKLWLKIGKGFQHTHERQKDYNLFKLEDEIRIQEAKMIWRWERKKITIINNA